MTAIFAGSGHAAFSILLLSDSTAASMFKEALYFFLHTPVSYHPAR